jgi:hypothetical protein
MMPDLTIVYLQACATLDKSDKFKSSSGHGTYETHVHVNEDQDSCTCPGFQYRRKCKHVTELRSRLCGWNEQFSEEVQTPQQEMEGICPKCGGETFVFKAGV